jgi:hypothetical protein
MKIKSYIVSQLILIVDGMALMSKGNMFFKILILFVTVVTVYWNIYDYYKEVKKNEILENK